MKITGFFGYQYLQKLSINRLQRNNLQEKETSETAAFSWALSGMPSQA